MTLGSATIVFLDANILAKPVTRTLLMVGGVPSGFQSLWSEGGQDAWGSVAQLAAEYETIAGAALQSRVHWFNENRDSRPRP